MIDGQVEGKINLNRNALTVGEHGKVKAAVVAKTVVVAGKLRGDIMAAENVDIRDTCSMEGNICTPRLAIAPGAYFRGGIDMPQSQSGRPAADVRRRQRSGRAGQTPREERSEAGVRPVCCSCFLQDFEGITGRSWHSWHDPVETKPAAGGSRGRCPPP